jgi:predicted MFS family arabinose efflux permease
MRRPDLAAAVALNGVMAFTMASVLAIPVLAPAIAGETGLPPSLIGAYSFFMWSAAILASGVAGTLIGMVGAVRVVQLSLALCAVGLAAGASGSLVALALAPLFIGLGCGVETPASSEILARVTRPERRAFIFSLKQTGVQIGGVVAGIAFPATLATIGWRGALGALAAILFAYAVALEPMRRRLDARHAPARPARGAGPAVAYVLRTPTLRTLSIASFAFHAMQVCLNTFLVTYLVSERGLSLALAGLLLSVAQLGGFAGRLGFGLIVGPRLPVLRLLVTIGFGMTACAAALGIAAGALHVAALGALCFLFGLTAAGWNGVFLAEIAREAPSGEIARVTGGVMVIAYAGLILGPVAFAAAAAGATLGAGYVALAAATLVGSIALGRARPGPPRPV